jgi:hypothetical protein
MGMVGRMTCPVCTRECAIRRDGRLHRHRRVRSGRGLCQGSGVAAGERASVPAPDLGRLVYHTASFDEVLRDISRKDRADS